MRSWREIMTWRTLFLATVLVFLLVLVDVGSASEKEHHAHHEHHRGNNNKVERQHRKLAKLRENVKSEIETDEKLSAKEGHFGLEAMLAADETVEEIQREEAADAEEAAREAAAVRRKSQQREAAEDEDERNKEGLDEEEKENGDGTSIPEEDDGCKDVHCGPGRECVPIPHKKAECQCIRDCPIESDPRRKVCSNHNETWDSDCVLYQMRCLCTEGDRRCHDDKYKHVHVEYYGMCKDIPECFEEEMEDFRLRMRQWLFNVMKELRQRKQLTRHYDEMEEKAESAEDATRRWSYAAVWKWCDLDSHPHDRKVSRHELFPLRATLIALEHCIGPFFDGCDADNDHSIDLREWGKCLQVSPEEIDAHCDGLA